MSPRVLARWISSDFWGILIRALLTNQIDSEQFEKILRYIRSGVDNGATLETGGERYGTGGYFIKPTVFSNVKVDLLRPPLYCIFYPEVQV